MEKRSQEKFVSLFMLASQSISAKLEELRNNLDPDDQLEPIGRLDPALMEDHINSNIGTPVQPILHSPVRADRIPTFTSMVCSCNNSVLVEFYYIKPSKSLALRKNIKKRSRDRQHHIPAYNSLVSKGQASVRIRNLR